MCRLIKFAMLALFALVQASAIVYASECFDGTRTEAKAAAKLRLGYSCRAYCTGCGCKSGPGYRKPNGSCASKADLASGACGAGPSYEQCARECTPMNKNCTRGPLPRPADQPHVIDTGLNLFEITGEDENGRRAAFDILMISEGMTWGYKNQEVTRGQNRVTGRELIEMFRVRFGDAQDIIASGTASSEGNRSAEERRAANRGKALAKMAFDALPSARHWVLNLGQHLVKCSGCSTGSTAPQRPVFLVAVVLREPEVDLKEALQMALGRSSELPGPDQYSLFHLVPFR